MSKSYEATGIIQDIFPATVYSETFKKQEFILKIQEEGSEYVEFVKFQTKNSQCQLLTPINIGDQVNVKFNLSGRMYDKEETKAYWTNLDVWHISIV